MIKLDELVVNANPSSHSLQNLLFFHFNLNFIELVGQENKKMDINNLIQKIMSITDQSLKEAEKRFLF